jgi:signal peptidase II
MRKENRPLDKWTNVVLGCVGLFVILADQLTKSWIRTNLYPGQSLFDAGYFRIIHIYNTGAAFGILQDHSLLFIILAIIGIIVILSLVFTMHSRWTIIDKLWVRAGIGMVLGGTAGNLIDRLLYEGRVTDFIDFRIWPAFNIADSAVTVGAILIICFLIFLPQSSVHEA